MRNITPYIATNTRIMPPVPVLNAGMRKKCMSSMGSGVCNSHATNNDSTTIAIANASRVPTLIHPLSGASMSPYTRATMPMIESTAPIGSNCDSSGSRDLGTRNLPAISAKAITGTLMRKIEPYQKWPSRRPLATGPNAPAAPVTLAQIAIAFGRSCAGKTLMMIDNVDGMISAPAIPMTARHAMSWPMPVACDAERGADEEQQEAELQRALAAETVAQRAGREEEPGEDEGVDGDDPLELRLGCVQLARERGDGDVQARVADEDDQQAQTEHGQRPPAAVEGEIGRTLGRGFHGHSGGWRVGQGGVRRVRDEAGSGSKWKPASGSSL